MTSDLRVSSRTESDYLLKPETSRRITVTILPYYPLVHVWNEDAVLQAQE